VHSSFSFLDGVSAPEKLVERAAELGLKGLGLTDHKLGFMARCGLQKRLRRTRCPPCLGQRLRWEPHSPGATPPTPHGAHLLALAKGKTGYHQLSAALTQAHLATEEKGTMTADVGVLAEHAQGEWLVLTGCRKGPFAAPLPHTECPQKWSRNAVKQL